MQFILFILFVVFAIANSKKKAAEKKRKAASQQQPTYVPPVTVADALTDGALELEVEIPLSDAPLPTSGSMAYDSMEGFGAAETMSEAYLEGMPMPASSNSELLVSSESSLSSITHVVRPFTESGHHHTESSLSGDEPCPPEQTASSSPVPLKAQATPLGLRMDHYGVRQGLIYAEILGRPKALQPKVGRQG